MGINKSEVRVGEPVRAGWINDLPRRTVQGVVAGPGMVRTQIGNQVVVSTGQPAARRGGMVIRDVASLPAIPTSGSAIVYWCREDQMEGADGEGLLWMAHYLDTEWTPLGYTDKAGTPGEG